MGHEDMARIAAIDGDAEVPRPLAQGFSADGAARTDAAADPGIDRIERAGVEPADIGAGGLDVP